MLLLLLLLIGVAVVIGKFPSNTMARYAACIVLSVYSSLTTLVWLLTAFPLEAEGFEGMGLVFGWGAIAIVFGLGTGVTLGRVLADPRGHPSALVGSLVGSSAAVMALTWLPDTVFEVPAQHGLSRASLSMAFILGVPAVQGAVLGALAGAPFSALRFGKSILVTLALASAIGAILLIPALQFRFTSPEVLSAKNHIPGLVIKAERAVPKVAVRAGRELLYLGEWQRILPVKLDAALALGLLPLRDERARKAAIQIVCGEVGESQHAAAVLKQGLYQRAYPNYTAALLTALEDRVRTGVGSREERVFLLRTAIETVNAPGHPPVASDVERVASWPSSRDPLLSAEATEAWQTRTL